MVDRTNGRRFVGALRAAGVSVVTLGDVWGEQQAQDVTDPMWISHAAERGYTAITADDDLRYAPSNKQALTGPWMAKLYGDGVGIVWPPELRTLPWRRGIE